MGVATVRDRVLTYKRFETFIAGEIDIFEPIQDTRSPKVRFWGLAASLAFNFLLLGTAHVAYEISAVRNAADRMTAVLRKDLENYRIVLLAPKVQPPEAQRARPRKTASEVEPKPLAQPDARIFDRLDPRLADFVKENPAVESILTREIVRDIDHRVLVPQSLLKQSSLQLSFQIDENGRITRRRIERSSKVPSIDHLAMEMITLLEKYQFLASMKGLRRVLASIRVDEEIEVRFEGEASDETAAEGISKQLQNLLVLLRFAMEKDAAAFILDNITLETRESHVLVSKAFEKQPLIDFLMHYYRTEPQPAEPARPPEPADPPEGRAHTSRPHREFETI